MQHRYWPGDVVPSHSGRCCSVYKLQDRKGYGLTKTSLISSFSYLNLGSLILFGGFSSDLWVLCNSVAPQLDVWRAVGAALVTDIEGIQNKVICLWIRTTWPRAYARGVGVNPPPWAWYFTKTLLPAQRRLTVFAYFLLVNLSTYCKYHRINLHANFKEHCKWAKK